MFNHPAQWAVLIMFILAGVGLTFAIFRLTMIGTL